MLAETLPNVGPHVVRVSRPLVDTIGRYVGQYSTDPLADMLRSTIAGVSVACRWYRRIVNHCFAEIAAVSLPTGDVKEEAIT